MFALCHCDVLCSVLFYSILFSCTASLQGALNFKRHPAGKKIWKEKMLLSYWLGSSSVHLSVSTQAMCQDCFCRNVPGIAPLIFPSLAWQFLQKDLFALSAKNYGVFSFLRAKFLVPTQDLIKQDSLHTAQCCEKPLQSCSGWFPDVLATVLLWVTLFQLTHLWNISKRR